MLEEAEAIPFEPGTLLGERLLVLAPHPDDEVIGCGGVLAQHVQAARLTRVIVATDGAAATPVDDVPAYRQRRQDESRAGLAVLGASDIRFLDHPDRGLSDSIADELRAELLDFRPDLVLLPSLVEVHPDHRALAGALCRLVQRDAELFAALATTKVAFYEVSQPLRPNTLVDITPQLQLKHDAIAAHQSQTALRDYSGFILGLNAYRAMTLGPEVKAAEAYFVVALPELRLQPITALQASMSSATPAPTIVVDQSPTISVIVRTKDRPHLLREALDSIKATGYPASVIVVNDGGAHVDVPADVHLVEHETSRGRSEAMNVGVRAAATQFIAFLDDDDLFYPEHLQTLANATRAANHVAWYTDAVSAFLRVGSSGAYETTSRLRLFGMDFDRDLLVVDNYIPLPTLLVRREDYLGAGGFDPAFDLFEDWDFLLRLSQRGSFLRIPTITCEIRHFEAGSSVVLSQHEGTDAFRRAKLSVWKKHATLATHEAFARAIEARKSHVQQLFSARVDAEGRAAACSVDVARLERDKKDLIAQIAALHHANGKRQAQIAALETSLLDLQQQLEESRQQTAETQERLRARELALEDSTKEVNRGYAEIQRLQQLLDMIFRSKTWKVHTLIEKVRGRG